MRRADRFLKRAMSVIVTGVMVLSMMPATIYANEEVTEDGAVNEVLAEAGEDLKFVKMNVPYRDLYEALGVEVDNQDHCYDAVTTATTRFFYTGTGTSKGTYSRVERDAEGTVTGGDILGVTYPVAMSGADYDVLAQDNKTADQDHYFTECTETPDSYMTMTYDQQGGTYSFSADTIKENTAEGLEVINFTTEEQYGDHQIELKGVYPQKPGADAAADPLPGVVIGDKADLSISGVILTTDDGEHYGMGMLENIWVGTRREWVEIAWSVPEGNGLTNHGGAKFKTFDLNGKTLKEVKVITDQGIYTIACDQQLTGFYSGAEQVEARIADPQTLEIRVPEAFSSPKVTVSYKSGRNVVYVAENAVITDGKVALQGVPEEETTYSVKVASDNYAPKIVTVTYGAPVTDTGITDAQREKLDGYIAAGTAWVKYDPKLTLLAAHIQEAQELLGKEGVSSKEAEELIGELEELIQEAQQKYPGVTPGETPGETPTDTPTVTPPAKQASKVTLANKTATYTGKAVAIGKATVTGSKGAVTYRYYSDKKCTKAVAAAKVKNAGTYYVKATVAADSTYNAATSNVATLKIAKAAQKIKGATTSKTIKSTKLKKAAQSFSIGAKATSGKVTYKKTSGNKNITVSASGKVKVAKGLKKGSYNIKVQIKAKATTNYAAQTQTKTIKIKVS